jgi:signal transduction histidine kinase
MKKLSHYPYIFVFIFGAVLASLIFFFLLEKEDTHIRLETHKGAKEFERHFEEELLKSKSFLHGIEGLFYSSEEVTRREFHAYCKSVFAKKSSIRMVEWQPKVLDQDREKIEGQARRDGLKGFQFFEIDALGREISALKREVHFPVFYSFSLDDHSETVGLDLAFSPLRMKSKYESMRNGKTMGSETFGVIVKDSKLRRLGMAFTHPIYKNSSITSSNDLNDLKGFLAIVIDLDKILKPIREKKSAHSFQFIVKDETDNEKIIFSTLQEGEYLKDFLQYNSLSLNGRIWGLYVYPTKDFYNQSRTLFPWVIFILILFISFFLAYYLYIKNVNELKIRDYERKLDQKHRLESIGLLASGVAHEFNNVLQGIILANENCRDNLMENSLEHEYVDITLDLCHRGRDLVCQILSFARKEAEGEEEEIIPSEVIRENIKILSPGFGENIKLVLNISDFSDRPLLMGPHHLAQIIVNLCNNAIDAMEKKGTLEITYQAREDHHFLSVKDNGKGMDESVTKKIFDPFYTTKSVNEATGLGLFIVYGIVKSYHGDIKVISERGEGTEFHITLPNR